MPPVDFTTIEGLRAQLERPLIIGIIGVYLIHIFAVVRYAMPLLAARDQKRFLIGMTAAFAIFAIGTVVAYEWTLRWLMGVMLTAFPPSTLYGGGFSSEAIWWCFGAGMLCEIPVLTWVFGRFGIPVLQKREGYSLILILTAMIATIPNPLTWLVIGISSIALYELALGILRLQKLKDDERYSY